MRRTSLTFILLISSFALHSQEYFRSNSLAMEIEKLDENNLLAKDEGWVVEVNTDRFTRELTLYYNGLEKNRFERRYNSSGQLIFSSRLKGEILLEESHFDRDGRILRETSYREDGTALEEKTYNYSDNGELESVEIEKGGQSSGKQNYSLRKDGSLRSVETVIDEAPVNSSSVIRFNESLYMDDQTEGDIRVVRFWNPDRQLKKKIQYLSGIENRREEREYDETGLLSKVVIDDLSLGKKTVRTMNSRGLVEKEELYLNDEFQERILNYYEADRLVRKERRGSGFRQSWFYKYIDDVLAEEEFYNRGVLEYRKIYDRENLQNYVQELYDREELFMKVYYKKDAKIREEFISGGEVTRTREWGNP